jgi:hypothetical protein
MEDKESQQFNPEILNFPNDRKNLVIEIGTGGPATLMLRDIPNYLKENYANYLGSESDTVWIRNFRGLGMKKDSVLEGNVANAAYEMLKLGGELIIINTYDVLPEGGVEKVREALEKVGFNVEPIDLEREIHPFVAGFRRLDEQLPPDIGPKPTKYGFKATK